MRRIGLAALTVLELSPAEQIGVAAEAGYDFVGLRLVPVEGQPYRHAFDAAELEKRLADTGMQVLDVEVFRLAPQTKLADFEPAMAIAERLGATELLVHGADPDEARLAETWGRFCDLARKHRLAASLEPMPWVDISTVAKANRILNLAPRENAALLVDPIHFYREANSLSELSNTKTRYLQFCDARAERPASMDEIRRQAREDRLMPGEGGLDLKGLLKALPPDLPIGLEIPYAKPMSALERAKLAIGKTRQFLKEAS
jgi:sugar phosphate isomerase/epimerase